ncbi:MAG: M20/M25/M40 family metallo-hydrolase [Planctomycetota bacterium]
MHPIGSAEHERVKNWLLARFLELGLEPEVQTATAAFNRASLFATVQNLVALLPGSAGNEKAILLAAHYDSVPTAPGAADDAAGVAALLEVLRALRAGPPLKNDVIFLITDGEEVGMMGARAFVDSHPAAERVGVVINLEARGHRGPSIMFETSDGNDRLVRHLNELADPVAGSLTYEVYRALPNDTDMSVFKEAGMAGLNFAFIGGLSHYHTVLDSPANLDPGSLQHHGESVLSLTRSLGDVPLETLAASGNRTYFSLLRGCVVHYPEWLAWPFTLLSVVMVGLMLSLGVRVGRLSMRSVQVGVRVVFISAAVSVLVSLLLTWLLTSKAREDPFAQGVLTYGSASIMVGLLLITLSLHLLVLSRLRARSTLEALWAGALLVLAVLNVLVTLVVPGASYVLTWPLLAAALALFFLLKRHSAGGRPGPGRVALLLLAASPALILWVPFLWLLYQALTIKMAAVVVLLATLLLGLLLPHCVQMLSLLRRAAWILPGLAGFGFVVGAVVRTEIDAEHPHTNSIFYALDLDRQKAVFGTHDPVLDSWTGQFLTGEVRRDPIGEYLPGDGRTLLQADAPVCDLEGVRVEFVGSELREGIRHFKLRCFAPEGARAIALQFKAEKPMTLLRVNELGLGSISTKLSLQYLAVPFTGIEIEISTRPEEPVTVTTLAKRDGLPVLEGFAFSGRDNTLAPWPNRPDTSYVKRIYEF